MSDLNPALQFQNRKRADKASDAANGSSVTGDTIDTKNYDIINSYNFVLRVEGFQNLPLKAVRGINKQNEYEYIQEGGLNDYVHMVRKPISQPFTFQVERYVAQGWLKDAVDPLANGTELMLPLVLYMYRSNAHDGTAPSRYYIFTNCRVTGVQVGDLDAEKSGLHTITNTIAYAQMMIVTLPFLGIDDDAMYSFNKDNAENKTNTSHVRTLKDMGYTKMNRLDPAKDRNPDETDEDFARRSASVDYRGTRSKEDMKSLSIKYKYVESKPVKGDEGTDTEESRNKNTKQVVAQTNNRKGVKRKFIFNETEGKSGVNPNVIQPNATNPMGNGSVKSANTKNVEKATSKKAMENIANSIKYRVRPEFTEHGQGVIQISRNLAMPEKMQLPKSLMKEKAAERKYSADNKNPGNLAEPKKDQLSKSQLIETAAIRKYSADNKNPGNLATPKKKLAPKSNLEAAADARKYKFKTGEKANLERLNASVNVKVKQLDKEGMEGKAKKYNFKNDSNGSVIPGKSIPNKKAMEAIAKAHREQPHYASQKNEKAEVRNSYKYGGGPTDNVQIPIKQFDKKMMESAARKYPKTRSARDVIDFLGRKK